VVGETVHGACAGFKSLVIAGRLGTKTTGLKMITGVTGPKLVAKKYQYFTFFPQYFERFGG
jgi:hypothetical protein